MTLVLVACWMAAAPADAGTAAAPPSGLVALRPSVPLKSTPAKPPRELITIEGVPSLMAFIDREQVGIRQGQRLWAWSLPRPLEGEVPDAFTVPGRPDQVIVCMNPGCPRGERCDPDAARDRPRPCVWLAPRCDAAALLADRYTRVTRKEDRLVAQVFTRPACVPGDGPELRWPTAAETKGSQGPTGYLHGVLEPKGCEPPAWEKTLGAFVFEKKGEPPSALVKGCPRE